MQRQALAQSHDPSVCVFLLSARACEVMPAGVQGGACGPIKRRRVPRGVAGGSLEVPVGILAVHARACVSRVGVHPRAVGRAACREYRRMSLSSVTDERQICGQGALLSWKIVAWSFRTTDSSGACCGSC